MVLVQHDAQMDYYGKRLATCSSDRTVRIFEVVENTQNLVASLPGWAHTHTHTHTFNLFTFHCSHEGPVWQVDWAHPKFGSILASCSYDRKVSLYL